MQQLWDDSELGDTEQAEMAILTSTLASLLNKPISMVGFKKES